MGSAALPWPGAGQKVVAAWDTCAGQWFAPLAWQAQALSPSLSAQGLGNLLAHCKMPPVESFLFPWGRWRWKAGPSARGSVQLPWGCGAEHMADGFLFHKTARAVVQNLLFPGAALTEVRYVPSFIKLLSAISACFTRGLGYWWVKFTSRNLGPFRKPNTNWKELCVFQNLIFRRSDMQV